jgi:SAM-dependent methyltransferase
MEINYLDKNRASWNARTAYHVESEFYDVSGFLAGKTSLKSFELGLLGDVRGKRILHLQCHFGQDTISLARMGAEVVGVDLSDEAIAAAEKLAEQAGVAAQFVCSDVYQLREKLENTDFDIVFTSYGVLGWLPDMGRWGEIVAHYLKPKGRLILVEFHPVVWMYDDNFEQMSYGYFNRAPFLEQMNGTYADRNAPLYHQEVCWNHPLSEVFTGLLSNGLQIRQFEEWDYSPYPCFNKIKEIAPEQYQIEGREGKMPLVYALVCEK